MNQQVSVVQQTEEKVRCECGHVIFDGDVIKSRCVKVGINDSQALCRCKRWKTIPVKYSN